MLAKVERAGLVEKRRSEGDRRIYQLRLTDEGLAQADRFEKEQAQQAVWLLKPLDDAQKLQLFSLLETLIAHWEPEGPPKDAVKRIEKTQNEKE